MPSSQGSIVARSDAWNKRSKKKHGLRLIGRQYNIGAGIAQRDQLLLFGRIVPALERVHILEFSDHNAFAVRLAA